MPEVIIKYHGDLAGIAAEANATAEDLGGGYAIVTLDPRDAGALYRDVRVEDVEPTKELYINDAAALRASCVPQAREKYGLTGAGVAVGVIDTGVDYTHPAFIGPGGSRIAAMWDQQSPSGPPPDGFLFGREYTAADFDDALGYPDPYAVVPPTDWNGHGTAVAGIAAGESGTAPGATVLAVRVRSGAVRGGSPTTDIMRGFRYLTDKARELDLPLCCNISFGMNDGSHRGDSLFETYLTETAGVWKTSVTVPTGNEGSAGRHYSGRLSPGGSEEIVFFTGRGLARFYLSLWKNFADVFSVELILPDGTTTGEVSGGVRRSASGGTSVTVIYGEPNRYSVAQEVFFDVRAEAEDGAVAQGVWRLILRAGEIANGDFDVWLPTAGEVGSFTYFANADPDGSLTVPSTADKLIGVAGYDQSTGALADFSGRGFGDGRPPGPDVAAPAVAVSAPRAMSGGGYSLFTGTSMAAPAVCGAAALAMEWGIVRGNAPFTYGERLRAFIRAGAVREPGERSPSARSGYGKLCVGRTLDLLASSGGSTPLYFDGR